METMTIPRQFLVTVDGSVNASNVTRAIKMLRGVTAIKKAKTTAKPRLYDPETGRYLNDKTMKMAYYSLNNDKFSESEIISIPIKAGFLESGTYQGTLSSNELGKVGGGVTHEAEATFNINVTATTRYYPVTFEQPEHGWLVVEANGSEIESGASIKERSTIVVSAIALEYPDYQLEQLTVNGREIENDSSFTLTEPVNIVAEFGSHVATGITKGEYRADNENTVVYDLSGRKVTDKQKSRNGGLREGVYIIRTPDGVRKISR